MPDTKTVDNMKTDQSNTSSEYHVASFVASAMADQLSDVQTFIADTEGAEIHATSDKGKIVFTLEGDSHKSIGKKIDYLKDHTGIINLSPVYHQYLAEEQVLKSEQQEKQLN